MSTKKTKRNAAATKERILNSAREAFLQASYEQVGVRDIAAQAGVDPSLINRYFGSKENLFKQVLDHNFDVEIVINSTESFVDDFLNHLSEVKNGDSDCQDLFGLILRSAVSPAASPIVSKMFHDKFTSYMASLLTGSNRDTRAALICSYLLGFRLMYEAFGTSELDPFTSATIKDIMVASLRPCVEGMDS